jgi:MHS family alpha-ketoglutarate permease-like MFS transporter
MLEMFPTSVRSSGVGLPYSLAVAVFGGTAPYVIEMLSVHGLQGWFPGYVSLLCLVTALTAYRQPETKDADLAGPAQPAPWP